MNQSNFNVFPITTTPKTASKRKLRSRSRTRKRNFIHRTICQITSRSAGLTIVSSARLGTGVLSSPSSAIISTLFSFSLEGLIFRHIGKSFYPKSSCGGVFKMHVPFDQRLAQRLHFLEFSPRGDPQGPSTVAL